ncbi:MAG: hypothetical protein J6W13_08550 [Salinivirgaceae bacterium]|nr:hypothetical protein [Salinivirgaceae bacterium]
MKKCIYLTAMLLSIASSSFAGNHYWAMNTSVGVNFFGTTDKDMDNIRAYQSSRDYQYGWDPKVATSFHFGFTPEYYINNRISLSTGLRLTNTWSKYESRYDFFYYKTESEGYNTYYYTVRSISQSNTYVGIPLEFRFTIRGSGRPTPYIRAGATFNFRCTTATKTNMYHCEPGIKADIKIPDGDNFTMPVYAAAGIQIGRKNSFCAEFVFPYIVAVGTMTGFGFSDNLGGGFQISYQFAKNKSEE